MLLISFVFPQNSTWSTQVVSGTYTGLNDIFFINSTTGWVVGDNGTILYTTNGGETWTPQTSNTTYSLNSVYFIDADTGWVAGYQGVIINTTDGGATWNTQYTGLLNLSCSGTCIYLYDIYFINSTF